MLSDAHDMCAQTIESFFYMLISAVYLLYVVNAACAVGAHSSNEQCYARSDVWARHSAGMQTKSMVVSHNHCSVWVAEYYLCAHVYEFVHKEQSAFKHFLVE